MFEYFKKMTWLFVAFAICAIVFAAMAPVCLIAFVLTPILAFFAKLYKTPEGKTRIDF